MYINCSIILEKGVINMAHTYSYRADSKDHDEVKRILDNLGLDMSTSIKMYFKQMIQKLGLVNNIVYDGWQNDLNAWVEDKNYILCNSSFLFL